MGEHAPDFGSDAANTVEAAVMSAGPRWQHRSLQVRPPVGACAVADLLVY